MFIDLSGFTPLTEALMGRGNRGAEELSYILNEIFEPLVSLVYTRGGFIPYFAGDAFTAVFPKRDGKNDPLHLIHSAAAVRNLFSQREFKFGEFTIGLKIGLSVGPVEWGIVGNHYKSYYFRGKPIDSCAECQTLARNQDIVMDEDLRWELQPHHILLRSVSTKNYLLEEEIPLKSLPADPVRMPPLSRDVVSRFLPEAVVDYSQSGEFRTILTIFISFGGVESHELLDTFASIVLRQINDFSGYFKEIDFGDKGGVMVCFFGAPVSFENNMTRALEFTHGLRNELRELQTRSSLCFRVGMTIGTAYTGIVGGRERCQYAAVGNRVNLAARLMTYADWGEVLVDEEINKNRDFIFQHRGDIRYKGIKGNVPTFKLIGRNYESTAVHTGRMVGREEELKQLYSFSNPLLEGRPAGLIYIYGEAGIGKSRLTYELRKMLTENQEVKWYVCQTDQILKKPFNPFIYFLRNYFKQSPDASTEINRQHFEARFEALAERLSHLEGEEPLVIRKELLRTKSVLAAQIGITYPDSIWEQLDARGRYQNTLLAIINLFVAEALIQPIVLHLEDGHWIDENSEELMHELIRQMSRYPLLILITSRYKDDGSKPILINPGLLQKQGFPKLEINLNILQPSDVRTLAELRLEGPISEEFYELLLRTTNSNPFYLEQVLEYFSESNLLAKEDGAWNIKNKDIQLSSSINAILTARIDRLSALVKETVKAAAVIGREFELPILTEVMKSNEEFSKTNGNFSGLLKEQITQAERGQIWLAMNELRYIFRHSLLREAAYSMQLRARLQQLHRLIAEAIERLYADQIEERYVDLAFHYEQAGVFDKTCEYLRKAADYARRNYQNQQALDFYEKLLEKLSSQKDTENQIQTHLKRGKILELIGQWDECKAAYLKALRLAKKTRDALLLGHANNAMGRLMLLKGNYTNAMNYLQTAARLFESIENRDGIARVSGNLGNLYFRQGQYEEAKSYFTESIRIGRTAASDPTVNAQIVANLGLTYVNQGYYEEGVRVQQEQLQLCHQNNDKQGMATLYTYLGITYLEKAEYEEALNSFREGLKYSEELGNKQITSIAIGNIGLVFERQGDYEKAMEHYQRDLQICEELGDKQGTAIALGLIGQLLNVKGDFHKAIEYLQKDLMLSEELGYQKGIAKAVNTLGDVFYLTEQYDRSLHFYNRAIEVTRKIGNKLVLGFSLVEKGMVLIETGDLQALQKVMQEALQLSEELGNPDLFFEARLLEAKTQAANRQTDKAMAQLYRLLDRPLSADQEASVYFELFRNAPEELQYRDRALQLYRKLYDATPRYVFLMRIEQLDPVISGE